MYIASFLRKMGIDLDGPKPNFYNGFKVSGTEVTSTATELNKVDGFTGTYSDLNKVAGMAAKNVSPVRVARVALAALDTAGGVLSWANPEAQSILILGVCINVTTKSTGASTVDIGYAANGTTSNDSLIDGLDTGTGVGTYNQIDNKGTSGLGSHSTVMTSGQFITGSKASGACAGLVGYAYIEYCLL